MTTYKILKADGKESAILKDGKDSIPFSADNTDYQEYLKWLEAGNLPLPADSVEPSQASVTPLPADE